MLSNIGGEVNIGVTHCNHLGQRVSVDHIFLRLRSVVAKEEKDGNDIQKKKSSSRRRINSNNRSAALALGFLDTKGTRILNVRRGNIHLEGSTVLSDHRPVTAKIAWPRTTVPMKEILSSDIYMNVTMPLDPLEPAWGIVEEIE